MKITTRMLEDELYESSNLKGHAVLTDMRKGDVKHGLSPMEQVLSSLAACGAVDLVAMLRKRKKSIITLTIETEGLRREEIPRAFRTIYCKYRITSPDVTEEEFYKCTKLAIEKYCSVVESLKAAITFSVEVMRPEVS